MFDAHCVSEGGNEQNAALGECGRKKSVGRAAWRDGGLKFAGLARMISTRWI